MPVKDEYDSSWDLVESKKGNLPQSEEAWDKKYQEWQKRNWMLWLKGNLTFPFIVERKEDDDDAYFMEVAKHKPFRLGHRMKVITLGSEDDLYGISVKVREGRRIGHVPLCDVEVIPRNDKNYWLVKEYVVWFANR